MTTNDWATLISVIVAVGALSFTLIDDIRRKKSSRELSESDLKNRIDNIKGEMQSSINSASFDFQTRLNALHLDATTNHATMTQEMKYVKETNEREHSQIRNDHNKLEGEIKDAIAEINKKTGEMLKIIIRLESRKNEEDSE